MLLTVLLATGSACVTRTTSAYIPDPNAERMSLAEAQDALDRFVAVECPRLVQARRDLGEARVTVALDGSGNVTRSTLSRPFGDERLDRMFGGVTAQMRFQAPPDGQEQTGRMRVGYACGPDGQATATIELL